jgi:hypothetical protein
VRIHCRFNILAPLVADFISADYPYLRQITECPADLLIGSLERRFLRRMSHRLRLYIESDLQIINGVRRRTKPWHLVSMMLHGESKERWSARLSPTACTLSRTSPAPGCWRGSSSSCHTSGPPNAWRRTTLLYPFHIPFIVFRGFGLRPAGLSWRCFRWKTGSNPARRVFAHRSCRMGKRAL